MSDEPNLRKAFEARKAEAEKELADKQRCEAFRRQVNVTAAKSKALTNYVL